MQRPITRGASANSGLIFHVFAQDSTSTSGAGKASIGFGSWSCYYIRNGEAISGAITPQDITTIGTYAAPTANTNIRIKAVDNTNMIGIYEVQIHADWVNTTNTCQSLTIYLTASGVAVLPIQIPLIAANMQDTVRLGLTALPNAAADAAGGLPISDTGGLDLDAQRSDVAAILVDTGTTLDGRIPAALVGGRIDANVGAISSDATAADNAEAFFDGTGYAGTNNVIPTVTTLTGHTAQTGDCFARLGAPAGASVSADIAAIEAQTDDIGTAGAGLTAVPWNPAWDAEVQSEVEDALVSNRLDELLAADSDIDGAAPPAVGSVFHELMTKTTGSFTYDQTTDSLEAIKDSGGGGLDAAGVRAAVGLASANLDTQLAAIDDAVDTEVAAIKVVTDKLGTAVELDGSVYRFTTNALEQAPSGAAGSIVLGPEYA